MSKRRLRPGRLVVVAAAAALAVQLVGVVPVAAGDPVGPAVASFEYSSNMTPIGFTARNVPLTSSSNNSDLAFWGNRAYQGTYAGFRIIDISDPADPIQLINYEACPGSQGDIVVWENLLIRSWDAVATSTCAGQPTGASFEGLHIFDVSNPTAPVLLKQIRMTVGAERPFEVVINPPSTAAGAYLAAGAAFGPALSTTGLAGSLALVTAAPNAAWPTALPTEGCGALVGFPAGSIAVVDRGTCPFVEKAQWAQAAGATGMIVADNAPGTPATLGGTDPSITIPSVRVSQVDGATIKAGLPATGTMKSNPPPNPTGCGSHTNTILPDVARGNLYMYVGASNGACPGIDIVRVPINNPAAATFLRREPSGRSCHDNTVFLGTTNRIVCAGGNGFTVWSVDPSLPAAAEGGFEDPIQMYSRSVAGVTIAHSSAITYDGKVLVFGHEPGGGSQAQCQATSSVVNRSLFFFDTDTGAQLGTFVQPRPQTAQENCTWHNFNVIPTNRGYGLVVGSYQMGITVVDFTDPTAAQQIAYADPAPLNPATLTSGGDWSTYWYNGRIYESDIRRGLIIWKLDHRLAEGTVPLPHSNPQTSLINIARDLTGPQISITVPQAGNYGLNSSHTVDFSCSDPDSGVQSCVGSLADGSALPTGSVGYHTITVDAEDWALNTSSVTRTYNVIWDQNTGLLPGLDTSGDNVAKAGSTVPVKFSLGADYGLDILLGALRSQQVDCTTGAPIGPETPNGNPGSTGFRYDASANQYIFNWKTDKSWAGTCRQLIVTLKDNTVHTASMRFEK